MPEWSGLGKVLTVLGLLLVILGLLLTALGRLPGGGTFGDVFGQVFGWIGKLPGDIWVKRDNFTFYFPLATSLIVSLVLSLVLFILSTFLRR